MPPELAERIKNLAQRLGRKQADVCRALMLPALDAAEKEQA
jgi:predicted DNA-binding protein